MANDRMYLRCKYCGETRVLYKFYLTDGGYMTDADKTGAFIWEHIQCRPQGYGMNLDGEPGFDLITESEAPTPRPLIANDTG